MTQEMKRFQTLTPEEFDAYLRKLQENPYQWPNDYFAWKKPDGSLFMVGIRSGQMNHILNHELAKDCIPHMPDNNEDYVSYQYSISPTTVHMRSSGDGSVRYDPVKDLVKKIYGYEYLGYWADPDLLMDSKTTYGRVLAHGRWGLAKEHILEQDQQITLADRISAAEHRGTFTERTASEHQR